MKICIIKLRHSNRKANFLRLVQFFRYSNAVVIRRALVFCPMSIIIYRSFLYITVLLNSSTVSVQPAASATDTIALFISSKELQVQLHIPLSSSPLIICLKQNFRIFSVYRRKSYKFVVADRKSIFRINFRVFRVYYIYTVQRSVYACV